MRNLITVDIELSLMVRDFEKNAAVFCQPIRLAHFKMVIYDS